MKAMILAAGVGSRLRPLTEEVPKALIEVGGRPLIEYALATLVRSQVREAIVNLHHHGSLIREHLGDGAGFGLRLRYSEEEPLLGSGGGIRKARAWLEGNDFATLNADTIIDLDLREVLPLHRSRRAIATLVLRKDADMEAYGVIRTDEEDRVVQFLDTPARGCTPGRGEAFMYTGVQVLSPRIFDYMDHPGAFSITAKTYPRLLEAGETVLGYRFGGRWLTVGTPGELAAARAILET